jgi:hypothetical protein
MAAVPDSHSALPFPQRGLERYNGPEVLQLSYPELQAFCRRIVKEDGRLTDDFDRMHVTQKLFTVIGFKHDTRASLSDRTTTVAQILDSEVRRILRINQECMVEGPL